MRWPLRYQILVPFAAMMVVLLVAVSVLNAWLAAQQSFRQTVGQLREVAHTLADPRFPLTDAILKQIHGLSGTELVLCNDSGEVLAASLSLARPLPSVAAAREWQQLELDETTEVGDERLLSCCVGPQPAGTGSGRQSAASALPRAEFARRPLAGGLSAAFGRPGGLGARGLVALAIAGRLSRPMTQLRWQVGRLPAAISNHCRCRRMTTSCAT